MYLCIGFISDGCRYVNNIFIRRMSCTTLIVKYTNRKKTVVCNTTDFSSSNRFLGRKNNRKLCLYIYLNQNEFYLFKMNSIHLNGYNTMFILRLN